MDLENALWKGEMSISDYFAELRRLDGLLKSFLHRTSKNESEIVWINNYLLIRLKLTLKKSINHDVVDSEFEKDFRVLLQYLSTRVGSNVNDLENPILILERIFHSTLSPLLSYYDKISTSYVVLLFCLHFFHNKKYDSVQHLTAWFSKNSRAIFSEQGAPLCPKTELQMIPFLLSDITCWRRSSGDLMHLFRILSSLCLIDNSDYSSMTSMMESDCAISDTSDEVSSISHYIHALSLYKSCKYDEAVSLLYRCLSLSPLETLRLNIYLLLALSFSRKGKHQLSIQMLKNCLAINQTCRISILLLSYQYGQLNRNSSEIQSLDILYELINITEHHKSTSSPLMYDFIRNFFPSSIIITTSQLLFQLALRNIEIGKCNKASAYFEKFMAISPTDITTGLFKDDFSFFGYVDMHDAYRKMTISLLKVEQFTDVICLCERILKSTTPSDRMDDNGDGDDDDEDFNCEMYIYKAQASHGLKEHEPAFETISRAIIKLEAICIYKKDLKGGRSSSHLLNLLCDAYGLKSRILVQLGRFVDAIHYARMAYQICRDPERVLHLSSALAHAGRKTESALVWLKFRKYSSLDEESHLRNLVVCQSSKLLEVEGNEKTFLCKDIESLKILQQKHP